MKNASPIERVLSIVILLLIAVSLGAFILYLSSGAVGLGEAPLSPDDNLDPLILSENPTNKVLRLWTPPSLGTSVLYDEWNFILFGENGTNYQIKINGIQAFNGSIGINGYLNLSYDASRLTRAHVEVIMNNVSYRWADIIVNHQSIDYGGGGGGGSGGSFTETDINSAKIRTAIGLVLSSIVTIPFVWKGVKIWRNKQGVVQW